MSLQAKRYVTIGLLLCVAVLWTAYWPASADGQEPDKPADEPAAEEPDPYKVPDGTPEELSKFIEGVLSKRPPDAQARVKAIAAMKEAADKILAGKPSEVAAENAVKVKTMFAGTTEDLEALAGQLQKADMPKLVRQVRSAVFSRRLRDALQGSREEAGPKIEKVIGQIKKFLAEGPLQPSDVDLAMSAGRMVEMIGNEKLAAETYTGFAKLFAASDDQLVVGAAKRLEGIVRRLTLIGSKIKVEGTILGGDKLDWPAFSKGKVVLVDFWATWCGPCVREIPNMKENYELYHDLGFEIVGISLDRSREQLESFIEKREVPWTIIYNEESPSPTPDYYGVTGIPTMILVGADGNVVSTRARGPQLRTELEKLLGPVEQPGEEKVEPEDTTSKMQDLFNGKDLSNWDVIGCEAEVVDGAILIKSGNGLIQTKKRYGDFTLELEWKALKEDRWDSGIYFRYDSVPQGRPWPARYQVNMRKGMEGNVGGLEGAASTGLIKPGEWNRFKLTVLGTTAALEINGKPAWKADGLKDPEGFISLQAEVPGGGQFLFRNVRIAVQK